MTDVTVILAAHGAGDASDSNTYVRSLAAALHLSSDVADIRCAFRKGSPSFADALTSARTANVLVVPIMTSEGYFSTKVLPAALAESPRWCGLTVEILPPVGMHPRIIDLTRELIVEAAIRFKLSLDSSTVILVGHGTTRHRRSRSRTEDVAAALGDRHPGWRLATAFLDESPRLSEIALPLDRRNVIAVPFLIGGGHHAMTDIPNQLGLDETKIEEGKSPGGLVNGAIRVCTRPLGMHREFPMLLRDIVTAALRKKATGVS